MDIAVGSESPQTAAGRRDVSELLLRLGQKNHFSQLHQLLKSVYWAEARNGTDAAAAMKDQLKLVILSLGGVYSVDEVWAQESARPGFSPRMTSTKALHREVQSAERRSSSALTSPRANGSASLMAVQARNEEELYSMVRRTDFAHVPSAGTFAKAARAPKPQHTPGPSDYNSDFLTVLKQSPRAVIPRSGTRHEYIQRNEFPGPGQYYPIRRFVSKGKVER